MIIMIKVIITADDFGMSKVFNEKTLELLEKGFITSTNVMVKRVTSDQQSQLTRLKEIYTNRKISVGLHCEFIEQKAIKTQISEQYKEFHSLFGFYPTHLDIHKTPATETIETINNFAGEKNLPVRNMGITAKTKQTSTKAFVTRLYTLDEMINFFKNMLNGESYELVVHPGEYDPNCKSSLNEKRKLDYDNIIKIQDFIKNNKSIQLVCYAEL